MSVPEKVDSVKEFGEGVDRMCRELSAIGTKEPQYHLVAFTMKATVWANVLEKGQEKVRKGQENIFNDQKRPDSAQIDCGTTQKIYPETAQKLPRNRILRLHLRRKELSIFYFTIHMQDVKKSHLTWAHCQKMG